MAVSRYGKEPYMVRHVRQTPTVLPSSSRMPYEQAVRLGYYSRGELQAKAATVVVSVGLQDLTFSDYAAVEKEGV